MRVFLSGMFRCAVNGVRMYTDEPVDMMLSYAYLQNNPAGQDQLGTLNKIMGERMGLLPEDLFRTPEQRELAEKVVVLVGCGKSKLDHAAPAAKLYTGGLTKACMSWARRNSRRWFILSAKYGIVKPTKVLPPYNVKMSDHDKAGKKEWGKEFRERASELGLLGSKWIALCGQEYISAMGDMLWDHQPLYAPMEGLAVGKRLAWLKANPNLTKALLKEMPRVH